MISINKIFTLLTVLTVAITSSATVGASEDDYVIINDVSNPKTVEDFKSEISAFDLEDGDVTKDITVITDNYTGNERVLGEFIVVYGVSDSLGLESTIAVKIQNVDITAPEIILNNQGSLMIPQYSYLGSNLPDVVAIDLYEGDLTAVMKIFGLTNVDTDVLGDYTLTYQVSDSSGNTTSRDFTVSVIDSTRPVLTGPSTIIKRSDVILDSKFFLEYFASTDDTDGIITNRITIESNEYIGNANIPGTYNVDVVVRDSAGNKTTKTLSIIVVKDMIPQIIVDDYHWIVESSHQITDKEFLETLQFINDIPKNIEYIFNTTYDSYSSSFNVINEYQKGFSLLSASGEEFDRDITIEVVDGNEHIMGETIDTGSSFSTFEKIMSSIPVILGIAAVIYFIKKKKPFKKIKRGF